MLVNLCACQLKYLSTSRLFAYYLNIPSHNTSSEYEVCSIYTLQQRLYSNNMASQKSPSAVSTHFADVFNDIKLFLFQASRNPFVSLNLIFTLILTFSAMEKFGHTGPADVTHFTDMSFNDSARVPYAELSSGIPILPGIDLDADTVCLEGESEHVMYNLEGCFGGVLRMGRGGIFDSDSIGFEQNAFNVPHFIWVSSWFVTPIALFLVANAAWSVFNQWMWWSLYVFIMVWDVVGLMLMLVWHQSPLYNKIIAFVYFAFSALLMVSVRETWRVLSSGDVTRDDNGDDVTLPMKSHHPSEIPSFMQGVSLGVGPTGAAVKSVCYTGAAPGTGNGGGSMYVAVSSDNVPTVLAHTFTRTVLILCEFFFLIPVVASTAFVMSQERAIPFDVQVRAWQSSLLFGVVVVLEKARKTRLSYMTDTVLVMAAVVALYNMLDSFIPELIWVVTNVPMGMALSVMYTCVVLMISVALANTVMNMVYITFGGNDKEHLQQFQSTDAWVLGDPNEVPKTAYTRVVVLIYYFNVSMLILVKFLIMVVVMLGHMQNRRGSDTVNGGFSALNVAI